MDKQITIKGFVYNLIINEKDENIQIYKNDELNSKYLYVKNGEIFLDTLFEEETYHEEYEEYDEEGYDEYYYDDQQGKDPWSDEIYRQREMEREMEEYYDRLDYDDYYGTQDQDYPRKNENIQEMTTHTIRIYENELKTQKIVCKYFNSYQEYDREIKTYNYLAKQNLSDLFIKSYYNNSSLRVLVMEYGIPLNDYISVNKNIRTMMNIAIKCITNINILLNHQIIYSDFKMSNLVMINNELIFIDFGGICFNENMECQTTYLNNKVPKNLLKYPNSISNMNLNIYAFLLNLLYFVDIKNASCLNRLLALSDSFYSERYCIEIISELRRKGLEKYGRIMETYESNVSETIQDQINFNENMLNILREV